MTVRTRKGNSGFHSNIKTDHCGGKHGQITFSAVQVNLPALDENQKWFNENAVFHQEALTAGSKGDDKHFYRSYLLHTSVLTR